MTSAATTLTPPAHHEIILSRELDAPRTLVFEAWSRPEHIVHWWGPHGFTNGHCEVDLRAGGRFRLDMTGPDGNRYRCEGIYEEVSRPERIVYRGMADDRHPCGAGLPPHSRVTVSFDELPQGRTRLTVLARLPNAEARAATIGGGFEAGWRDSFERLDQHLHKQARIRQDGSTSP
ncbi:MAG: SRPBCC domain-containing protein [Rhodocyclaceae bacterium]